MRGRITLCLILFNICANAQTLKIRERKTNALNGSRFAESISDSSLSLVQREKTIYKTVKKGNVPQFYRKLMSINDSALIADKMVHIKYFVTSDYLPIGSDTDYFYCPMTPALAQRIANKLKCSLPTRKMVNVIYQNARIKLSPLPIPPSAAMSTVPAFIKHNQLLKMQRDSLGDTYKPGMLVAGDKKDVIISNRIYNDTSAFHVVIYGWHKLNGKGIQPLYARHLNTWADYSHGIRLIQNRVWIDGKKSTVKKVLMSEHLHVLLSDEGPIKKPYYPRH